MLEARPKAISSIMGLYASDFVAEMKGARDSVVCHGDNRCRGEGCRSRRGRYAVIAQGMEAGGHRGAFHANQAERRMVGLFALLPQVVDAIVLQ